MIDVSGNWINYFKEHDICKMRATLTDVNGNSMSLDEADFMMGSVKLYDSVSSNSAFEVGSVITNTIECVFNNIDHKFDNFNLNNARLSVEFGLEYDGNLFDGISFEYGYISYPLVHRYGYVTQKISINHGETYPISLNYAPLESATDIGFIAWYKDNTKIPDQFAYSTKPIGNTSDTRRLINSENWDYIQLFIGGDTLPTDLTVTVTGSSDEWVYKGTYTLDNPKSLGNTLKCIGYNDMDKLNKPYIGVGLVDGVITSFDDASGFSASWVEAVSLYCGVPFGSWEIENNIPLLSLDYNESTTCRDVISWILQINGGFARLDENDALSVRWYSPGTFQNSGTILDGGSMTPWNAVDSADGGGMNPWDDTEDIIDGGGGYLYELDQLSQATISYEDIHITGVRAYLPNTLDNPKSALVGQEGYVIQITDNPLITNTTEWGYPTWVHYKIVANMLYSVMGGYRFKTFDATLYGNPAMEAGDIIGIRDYRNHLWTSYITSLNYTFNGLTEARCEAETITEANSSYGNSGTSIASNAVNAVYDRLNANKLSASLIGTGTITDYVKAENFEVNGKFNVDGDGAITITGNVTANSFINTSQAELKENIRGVGSMLQKVVDADILQFNFKGDDTEHIGLAIGEDYNTPQEVVGVADGHKGIDLYSMVALAWKAIQEQQKQIEKLKGELDGNTDKKRN